MAYIDPPEPDGQSYIFEPSESFPEGWTWHQHREMEATLKLLESQDADVSVARKNLDDRLESSGLLFNGHIPQICEFCWKPETQPHDLECPESNDPSLWVVRERAGYQFLNLKFEVLHSTSMPMTDQEAYELIGMVEIWHPSERVAYIWARDLDSTDYKMLPYAFNYETQKVEEIESSN